MSHLDPFHCRSAQGLESDGLFPPGKTPPQATSGTPGSRENDLAHCIYASAATHAFSDDELAALLALSRRNNARLGITGMLLHVEGSFFQVLEGKRDLIDPMFDRICQDHRHTRVTRIISEPIAQRDFAEWSMGFVTMTHAGVAEKMGRNAFGAADWTLDPMGHGRARKLLQAFASGRWRQHPTPPSMATALPA